MNIFLAMPVSNTNVTLTKHQHLIIQFVNLTLIVGMDKENVSNTKGYQTLNFRTSIF